MSGNFKHSPAHIIRRLLIELGQGTDSSANGNWPIYATNEPDRPDECITIYNTQGVDFGRSQVIGERQEHYGFQVRIRYTDEPSAHQKMSEIVDCLDKTIIANQITIDTVTYCVQSVSRKSSILDAGYELPTSKRQIKTVNATAAIVQVSP